MWCQIIKKVDIFHNNINNKSPIKDRIRHSSCIVNKTGTFLKCHIPSEITYVYLKLAKPGRIEKTLMTSPVLQKL